MLRWSAALTVVLLAAGIGPAVPAEAGGSENPAPVTTLTVQGLVISGGTIGAVTPARDTTTVDTGGGFGLDLGLGWRRPRGGLGLAIGLGVARPSADLATPLYGGLYGVAEESTRLSRVELRAAAQFFFVDGERSALHLDAILANHWWRGSTYDSEERYLDGPAAGGALSFERSLKAELGWRLAAEVGGRIAVGTELSDQDWIWQVGIGFSRTIRR